MPRYFFHVRDGATLFKDEEGAEFSDMERVYDEAMRASKEAVAEHILGGHPLSEALNRRFCIADADGRTVLIVSFAVAANHDDFRP